MSCRSARQQHRRTRSGGVSNGSGSPVVDPWISVQLHRVCAEVFRQIQCLTTQRPTAQGCGRGLMDVTLAASRRSRQQPMTLMLWRVLFRTSQHLRGNASAMATASTHTRYSIQLMHVTLSPYTWSLSPAQDIRSRVDTPSRIVPRMPELLLLLLLLLVTPSCCCESSRISCRHFVSDAS